MVVLDENAQLRPAPNVHARLFDGELVILDLEKGEYFSLDEIGTLLWRGLETGKTLDRVVDDVVEIYDVERKQVLVDLTTLCDTLVAHGLVVRQSG
jgi:hypothetical protein